MWTVFFLSSTKRVAQRVLRRYFDVDPATVLSRAIFSASMVCSSRTTGERSTVVGGIDAERSDSG